MAKNKQIRPTEESRLEKATSRSDARFNAVQIKLNYQANFYEDFMSFDKLAEQFEKLTNFPQKYMQIRVLGQVYDHLRILVINSPQKDPLLNKAMNALEEKYSKIINIITGKVKLI